MKLRMAAIWFSCFCCASEKVSLNPLPDASASFSDCVLAVRHPLSAPY